MLRSLRKKVKPWHLGLGIGLLTLVALLLGWISCGQTGTELVMLAAVSLSMGVGVFILSRSKLRAWLAVMLIGWIVGLESAIELFLETPFQEQCLVALATAIFWMALALVIGALAEIIRFLHRMAHRIAGNLDDNLQNLADRFKDES